MIITNVYVLYTTRKQWRARFICLVESRYIAFRRDRSRGLGVDRDGSVSWADDNLTRHQLSVPLTLIYKGATLLSGGRKLAN